MKKFDKPNDWLALPFLSITCAILLIINCTSAVAQQSKESLTVNFAPGEIIQLIAPISDPEKQSERANYYQNAIPLAREYGFKNLGQLNVEKTILGDFAPGAFVIGSWPSKKAMLAFEQHPKWPALKTTRLSAWEELKLYNDEVLEPVSLKFKDNKTYTVAFAWTNPEHPDSYYQYLENLQPLLDEVGARFIFKMTLPELEAHDPNANPPQQITFVEWDSADGLQKLQAMPEYAQHYPLLRSGIVNFELHRFKPKLDG